MKRRRKRAYAVGKRCHCPDKETCQHHWYIRVHALGKRQRIDLTEMFPGEPVEVAAAKAKAVAKVGPVKPMGTRPMLSAVADAYKRARGAGTHYYLAGLLKVIGDKPVDDVMTPDIKRAVVEWKKRPKAGPVAIRHLLQTARHLFNWAIEEGYATRTPFKSPQGVNLLHVKGSKARSRRLEIGESDRILAKADPFITDFFTAMLETGCRPGELRTLQWSDVHDDHFVVIAAKAKDREDRQVPVLPTLRKILDRRKKAPDGSDLSSAAYVFGTETGEPLSRRRLCGLWLATCEAAKVTNLHLHDLRREFASQLAESKVPIHEVRDALGHSSTTMTSTYLGMQRTGLKRAYEQRAAHQARQAMRLARAGQSAAGGSRNA